jgi:hypothetical protein
MTSRRGRISMGADDKAQNKAEELREKPRKGSAGPPTTRNWRSKAGPTRHKQRQAGRREGQGCLQALTSHIPGVHGQL